MTYEQAWQELHKFITKGLKTYGEDLLHEYNDSYTAYLAFRMKMGELERKMKCKKQ